jgi:hypothetical protein
VEGRVALLRAKSHRHKLLKLGRTLNSMHRLAHGCAGRSHASGVGGRRMWELVGWHGLTCGGRHVGRRAGCGCGCGRGRQRRSTVALKNLPDAIKLHKEVLETRIEQPLVVLKVAKCSFWRVVNKM